MKKRYRLNVVIPVYNTEKYIETTIECLLNQTMKDFLVVFVNDGSTDGTLDILKKYEKKDKRIVVLNQENKGPGAARNFGLEYVYKIDSDYTMILDADDVYAKNMFEKMIDKAEKTESDIVICRARELDNQTGKYFPMPYQLKFELMPNKKDVLSYKDLKDYIFNFCVGWSWDKLYKTKFIKGTNLRFQELKNTDDAYFVFMSLVKAKSFTYIKDIMVDHRLNVSSSVSNSREKDITCFYTATNAIKKELISMGIYEEVEKGFLNWALNFCIWNIETTKNNQKEEMYNYLKNTCFVELGFDKHGKEYYSFEEDYDKYYFIKTHSYKKYNTKQKNPNIFQKVFRSLKYNGLGGTIKKVFKKLKLIK